MNKYSCFATVAAIFIFVGAGFAQEYKYPFQNPNLPIEARVTNILSLMTVDEKIAALSTDPSVPRLGIVGSSHIEGLHGVALGGPGGWGGRGLQPLPTTQFPQSVGLSETWDPELIRQAAQGAVTFGIPHEMVLLDLYAALRPLDAITGATTADDILNRIFSTFCIGK